MLWMSSHIDGTELPSCVLTFSCVLTRLFQTLVKMLMEGNEETFCVTLNNREPTSLDKVLLGNPHIVIPKLFPNIEPKPLSSIHQHRYHLYFWCDRDLKYPPSGNVISESLYNTVVLCILKGYWWRSGNVHLVASDFGPSMLQQQMAKKQKMLPFNVAGWFEGTRGWKTGNCQIFWKII